jgi:hypothetical protein
MNITSLRSQGYPMCMMACSRAFHVQVSESAAHGIERTIPKFVKKSDLDMEEDTVRATD